MARKTEHRREYENAFRSAAKVVRAIKLLDIPESHKRRYLDRAVWHVTVPKESLKYRTRFISLEALEIIETLDTLCRLRRPTEGVHKAANSLTPATLNLAISHMDEELRRTLEEVGVFWDKQRQSNLVERMRKAEKALRSRLRHEHVISRKDLVDKLLEGKDDVVRILERALSCVVTESEHDKKLKTVPKEIKGTDRYQVAGVRVMDMETKTLAPWSAP